MQCPEQNTILLMEMLGGFLLIFKPKKILMGIERENVRECLHIAFLDVMGVGQEDCQEEMRWHSWGIIGETFISMVDREGFKEEMLWEIYLF